MGCLVLTRAIVRPWDRRFALLLGVGGCSWALGDFAMTYETLGGASPASPSLANFLSAGALPLCLRRAVAADAPRHRVVDRGLELTIRADEGIRSLAETIREASTAAQQIAASAQEQSAGMDQVSGAMTDIERATDEFLQGSQHSQNAANTVDQLAAKLAALTARYRVAEVDSEEVAEDRDLLTAS